MPTLLSLFACRPASTAADFTLTTEDHTESFAAEVESDADCDATDPEWSTLRFSGSADPVFAQTSTIWLDVAGADGPYTFLTLGYDWLAMPGSEEGPYVVWNVIAEGCDFEASRDGRDASLACDGPAWVAVPGPAGVVDEGGTGHFQGTFAWTCPEPRDSDPVILAP